MTELSIARATDYPIPSAHARHSPRVLLYVLFAISGFSGLIYESIWSHYLKLFLGHAAYAQSLVLIIFMGGLALGSWLASRAGDRIRNLLLGYAIVEGAIGCLGLVFHDVFDGWIHFAHETVLPSLSPGLATESVKWGASAILIAPQSVLLGMTFPLMSGALVRRYPERSGGALAMLYFTNSIGAAIGVLVGGFVLVAEVGLPGTILSAGLINVFLAAVVWLMSRSPGWSSARSVATERQTDEPRSAASLMIAAAFVTGLASFVYEIGWLRMLSLVLGASTHAFELMLSAFILGLALGSLWIRRRIDQLSDPVRTLGRIQIAMAVLALSTLVAYGPTFDLMSTLMGALARNDAGYVAFNLGSHAIALAVMLPATICAGMTLPLITHRLMTTGHGEGAIGRVYAANTLGAIVGVLLAVHVLMPSLGVKAVIATGVVLDMGLGVVLLASVARSASAVALRTAALGLLAVVCVLTLVRLDPTRLASSVYRTGHASTVANSTVPYHRDGKTATVSLIEYSEGAMAIATNGKTDAAIALDAKLDATDDESTMTLIGALPLAARPHARRAAVIGFGAGMTTHTLLGFPGLDSTTTIEIEPLMVDAARAFKAKVGRAFDDPRSHVVFDDARTWLSSSQSRFDIIVSEPSNPWVSGVANLFTQEFYRFVGRHLTEGGVFAQWIHLYEINTPLTASVVNALSSEFEDYVIYALNDVDALIIASDSPVRMRPETLFEHPTLVDDLANISIRGPEDIDVLRIGPKRLLDPFFASFRSGVNSDYFPLLDLQAVRSRFLAEHARELVLMRVAALPFLEMLDQPGTRHVGVASTGNRFSQLARAGKRAEAVRELFLAQGLAGGSGLNADERRLVRVAWLDWQECAGAARDERWIGNLLSIANMTLPYLEPSALQAFWDRLPGEHCRSTWTERRQHWVRLVRAIADRDAVTMVDSSQRLLQIGDRDPNRMIYTMASAMLGRLALGDRAGAAGVWDRYHSQLLRGDAPNTHLRLLAALSGRM